MKISKGKKLMSHLWKIVSGNRCTVLLSLSFALVGSIYANEPEAAVEYRVVESEFSLTLELEQTFNEMVDGSMQAVKRTVPITSKFQYLSCVDANGKAVPSASNIVFYSPWLGEKVPFKDKNNRYYAEKLGWTVFAIPDMGYTDARMILAGQDKLTQIMELKPRKLLMYGGSSGATNSINASLLYPDRFDAVAAHSTRRWYPDKQGFTKKDSVVRLLTNNWYDGAGNEGVAVLADLKKLDMEGIHIETPPNWKQVTSPFFHRSPTDFSQALFHQYFKDIVKLRDANGGVVPPMKKWPVKIEKANGQALYLPGKNLQAVYQALPNDLVGKSAEAQPLFYPALSGKPAGAVLFLLDSEFKSQMKLLDLLYYFATKGNVDVYAMESADPQKIYLPAVKCLDSLKSDLPVYVVGLGKAGSSAVFAAVNSQNPQIAKVSTIGTDRNSSIVAEAAKKPNLPVVMYYDVTIASNESEGSIIGVNVDAKLGFGPKIFGVLDEAVKPEAVKPVESKKARPVNRLPELTAEVKSLKEKIHLGKPETIKVYIDKLEALSAEAVKLEKVSMIDLTQVYQVQGDLGEAQLEYIGRLNPGKSPEELNQLRIGILDKLVKTYEKHSHLFYSRYNAGHTIDNDEQTKLHERYFKATEELKQLSESQTAKI